MNNKKYLLIIFTSLSILFVPGFTQAQSTHVIVDLNQRTGGMKPIWAWFGYDEPNYTYMKNGKKLLTEMSQFSYTPINVRVHNLLTTGDGTPALKWGSTNIYTEDSHGNPIYSWSIIDHIFDTYLERGMRPLVQIGFMPEALSTNPTPYQHSWKPGAHYDDIYTGWSYPPNDHDKWRELIYQWALHCKERYGEEEASSWFWEVWNEPENYFRGTFEDYCKLYDYAADGLLKALPNARIGGPHSCGPRGKNARAFLTRFLEHCLRGKNYATGKIGSPLHYIGFHAKGHPRLVDGKVRMNLGGQLSDVDYGFATVASFPEFKHLPIIIGEFDPDACAACSEDYSPQNAYRNGTLFSSTVAISFARLYSLAQKHGINLEGAVTWSFSFEDQPWFAGFRDLYTNGVAKPVLNTFRMFGLMGGELVEAHSSRMLPTDSICKNSVRDQADIGVLASRKEHESTIMLWNYHDDNITDVSPAEIVLDVKGIKSKQVLIIHYRIDENHSNSFTVWKEMGSPQQPTAEQLKVLERSGELQTYTSPTWQKVMEEKIEISVELPRQGVSLIKIEW